MSVPRRLTHCASFWTEAATRLSKKLDVLQLCKVMGWRDPKFAMVYYAESTDDIADRL